MILEGEVVAFDPASGDLRPFHEVRYRRRKLPDRLAPLKRAERPARVDARRDADVWFEPGLVLEVLAALPGGPPLTANARGVLAGKPAAE